MIVTNQQHYMDEVHKLAKISSKLCIGSFGLGLGGMILEDIYRLADSCHIEILIGLPKKEHQKGYLSMQSFIEAQQAGQFDDLNVYIIEKFHPKYVVGLNQEGITGCWLGSINLHMTTYEQLAVKVGTKDAKAVLAAHEQWKTQGTKL